jgi:serine protease AprX
LLQRFLQVGPKLASGLAHTEENGPPLDLCRVLVEAVGVRTERVWSFIEANQGQLGQEVRLIPAVTATLPREVLADLVRLAPVVKLWENSTVEVLAAETATPVYHGVFSGEYQFTGKGVTVAVLDTGIAPHDDLTVPENRILAWNDLVGAQVEPYDDHGHGTHVAGLIAGNGISSRGRYKGVAPEARLAGVKVLDKTGRGRLSDLLLGMEWCLDNRDNLRIRVINLSLGTRLQGNYDRDPLCRAVALAWKKGIVVCAAAGKAGPDYRDTASPGSSARIITVGNLDGQKTLTVKDERLERRGRPVGAARNFVVPDLVAPGANVVAIKRDGGYCTYSGASTAAPLVSGGAALLLERWPGLQPDQVRRLLQQTAGNVGLGRRLQGAGQLNLDRIFERGRRRGAAKKESPTQLESLFMKGILNLLSKKTTQSAWQLKDILLVVLPMLNQILSGKEK